MLVGLEAEKSLDPRVVGCVPGTPLACQAERIHGEQQVLHRSRRSANIFRLNHPRIVGNIHPDRDQQRRAQGFGAFLFQGRRGQVGVRLAQDFCEDISPAFASLVLQHDKAPRAHVIMVRGLDGRFQEAADQWSLLAHRGGRRIAHKTIHYMSERDRFTERWHGALRDWPGALSLAWGLRDPVARTAVLDGLRELRPGVPTTELPDAGHYPQLDQPELISAALDAALAQGGGA